MKIIKKIKDKLYHVLVEKNFSIKYYHQKWVSEDKRANKYSIVKSVLYLIILMLAVHILRLKKYRQSGGKPFFGGSESELSYKYTPQEYAEILLKYDVISFDIFDTLVFRPFQNSTDLFYIVGQKLEYIDFANIRIQAEQTVRTRMRENKKSEEINIYDIYEYLEKYCGINAKDGVSAEYETELELIYANPFMKQVYDILVCNNKKIIAVSDMYMTREMIGDILCKCGYVDIFDIFISSEYKCGKYDGKLYAEVKNKCGKEFKYVQIGDNWKSDFENAKKYGFYTVYYENVNHKGGYYRSYDMSTVVGSAYRGIVNAHFHNGLNKYTMQYEYGFFCGGIFVLGYCNYIFRYVQNNNIDKILFFSRDGEILKKVYDKLYPGNNSTYAYWSRTAATKLGAGKFKYDYFRRFIYHKISTEISIEKVFTSMEINSLLPQFEEKYKIKKDSVLNSANAEKITEYIALNWDKVVQIYFDENEAAKRYYAEIINRCKRVCTVDIGWAGSGGIILSYLVRDLWKLDCEMFTLVAGTNTAHNYETNMSESFLQSGQMASYLYSQSHNRHFYHSHNPSVMHNVFLEMLLSSKTASLKGFKKTDNSSGYELIFAERNYKNDKYIDEIHQGILDFVDIYCCHFKNYRYMRDISGSDAYAPFRHLTVDDNKYFKILFKDLHFDIGIGEIDIKKIFN